jgi:hypothetical protein
MHGDAALRACLRSNYKRKRTVGVFPYKAVQRLMLLSLRLSSANPRDTSSMQQQQR